MNKHRFKWLGLVVLSIASFLVIGGCGGGGGSTNTPPAVAKVTGTVTFPTSASVSLSAIGTGKRAAKSVAMIGYATPTVELRTLAGVLVKTAAVTGTGTTSDPYIYTFNDVPTGTDYVVKAYIPDTDYVIKALVDKNAISAETMKNVNTVSTTAVIVTEQKLGATPGTMGDAATTAAQITNAAKFTTTAVAEVNPAALEAAIATAVGAVNTATGSVSEDNIKLVNLVNVVNSTVFSNVNTTQFIAGTSTATIAATDQYTYSATAAPAVVTAPVASAAVAAIVTATNTVSYAIPPADSVTYTSRVIDYSGTTAVAASDVLVTANVLTTYTDASGYYTLAGITKGTNFYVKMSKFGYADSYSSQMNITANTNTSDRPYGLWTPTVLTNWGNTSGNGIIRSRVVASTDLVSGYLGGVVVTATDSADSSITYPVIYVNASGALDSTLSSTAVENGSFMFRNVPAGRTVVVTATKAGYTFNSKTFVTVADSVCQGRLTGTAAAVVNPPVSTNSAIKESLLSGWYEFRSENSYNSNTNYYYISRMGLAADNSTMTKSITSYLDPVSLTWTSSKPTGFPTYNGDYTLNASGTWVEDDGPAGYAIVFNADGTATITAPTGSIIKAQVTTIPLAGLPIPTDGLDGAILLANASVFPTGSIAYNAAITSVNDSYSVWSSNGSSITSLAQVPAAYAENTYSSIYIDNNSQTDYFFAKFVTGSTTSVNIYKNTQNSSTAPTLIGTATAATVTVLGKDILEISIPATLKTTYSLTNNPILAVVNGVVLAGAHSFSGYVDDNKSSVGMLNSIAMDHVKLSVNTALTKPVIAKKISKSILGF